MMQVAHPRSRKTKGKEEEHTKIDKVFITGKGNINWVPLNVYFWDMPILKKKKPKNTNSGKNENCSNNDGRGDKAC